MRWSIKMAEETTSRKKSLGLLILLFAGAGVTVGYLLFKGKKETKTETTPRLGSELRGIDIAPVDVSPERFLVVFP